MDRDRPSGYKTDMRHRVPPFVCAIAAILALTGCRSPRPPPAEFYVSPRGNDAWSGRLAAPDAGRTDGPFATFERARQAVRELKAADPARADPIRVLIRGGTYRLPRTLVFEPADSGKEAAPVVYEAWPGEEPVLSGGETVAGWREVASGRWEVTLPDVAAGTWYFSQLYVNDQRRYRPVIPREGYRFIAAPMYPSQGENPDRFVFRPGEFRADGHALNDIEVTTFHLWTMDRLRIQSLDEARRVVTFTGPSHSRDQAPLTPSTWYRVENAREALSEPGEWYLDRASGVLTYLARPGERPDRVAVVAPRLESLVRFQGDVEKGAFVEHVVFRGLTFAHQGWNTPARGYGFPQCDLPPESAVSGRNARHCALEGCVVRHTAGYAVDWGDGCRSNRVERCELFDLGGGGVKIGPIRLGWEADTNKWAGGCVVRDTLIAHGGRVFPAAVGVWIGHADHNVVEHNEIFDFYYSAVSVGWKWGAGFSPAHHNLVASNHLHHLGQGVLSDLGGIYTLGESPGTALRANHIHHVARARYGGWGIYFDEGSSNVLAEANLVHHTQDAGLHQNYGNENIVRGNLFAFGTNGLMRFSDARRSCGMTIESNLFLAVATNLFEVDHIPREFRFRGNFYAAVGDVDDLRFTNGLALAAWRAVESDAVSGDPGLMAPAAGDFRFRPDSAASRAGYAVLDPASAGRRTRSNRTDRLPPVPPAFPPAPPPTAGAPAAVADDFELGAVGQRAIDFVTDVGGAGRVAIADDAAAGGSRHALRFEEGGGSPLPWQPHLYCPAVYNRGEIRNAFEIRLGPGAHVNWEWRDWPQFGRGYSAGPSITVRPDGMLAAAGKDLLRLPAGQWVRLEMRCGVGDRCDGTWFLAVTLPGEKEPRRFERLPCNPKFKTVDWMGFSSLGDTGTVFHVDNFEMETREGTIQ